MKEEKEDFIVYSAEEKSLCELLVFYTTKRNWNKVIQVAAELIELESENKAKRRSFSADAGQVTL